MLPVFARRRRSRGGVAENRSQQARAGRIFGASGPNGGGFAAVGAKKLQTVYGVRGDSGAVSRFVDIFCLRGKRPFKLDADIRGCAGVRFMRDERLPRIRVHSDDAFRPYAKILKIRLDRLRTGF